MRHFTVEVVFEAWDEEDAARLARAMRSRVDDENRLLFSTTPVETFEYLGRDPLPAAVRPDEGVNELA